jgi:CBS domain-containing protein
MTTVEGILAVKGPDVIVAARDSTVLEVSKLMAEGNVGSVIIREGREVLGIFTERDLLRRVVAPGKDPSTLLVSEVMSSPIRHCRLSDDISQCAKQLTDGHIRHLAVIEDGTLVGLVGLRDILAAEAHDASTADDSGDESRQQLPSGFA